MNYAKIYDSIISRGQSREPIGYVEKHHIVPRCMGGTDEKENIVSLTPEEHFVCHLLLCKIYPGNSGLICASFFLTSLVQGRKNKCYGWLKRRWSEYMRGPNNPQKLNPRRGIDHHSFGKKLVNHISNDGKARLSDRMKKNNPNKGLSPWLNVNATSETKSVWRDAKIIYELWKEHQVSYNKLYRLHTGKVINGTGIGPYMTMIQYFRKGWIPMNDPLWLEFKTNEN